MNYRALFYCITLLVATAISSNAVIRMPRVFSEHMVLQAGKPIPVWGTAEPGETITVSIAEQTKITTADTEGNWTVALEPLSPGSLPTLVVKGSSGHKREIGDVIVGEVWLCSGQSNMAMAVSKAWDFEQEKATAHWHDIRMFQANKWIVCSPETVGSFSATAYFFGREIHRIIGRPVGLLNISSGGNPISLWTSLEAQQAVPELKLIMAPYNEAVMASREDAQQAESDRQHAVETEGKKAVAQMKTPPGYLFDDRILPIVPFAITGVIWYQGEADSYTVNANLYGIQLETLIKDWRRRWGYDFPFISVQLPEIGSPQTQPSQTHGRVLVREGVLKSLNLPNTGMAITLGTGEEKNNHPTNKQEVGRRLAMWALSSYYGQKNVVASGPIPVGSRITEGAVVIKFSHANGGLRAQDGGELKGFAITGADGRWVWGHAKTDADTVIVSSP